MNNIYLKLQTARVQLQNLKLKKTGVNKFSGFTYYELADILPSINKIFEDLKLFSNFSISESVAYLTIFNAEKEEQNDPSIVFTMPTAPLELKGCTAIQALGGVNTYCKRYLYLNALEIVENDLLDVNAGKLEEIKDDTDIYSGLQATDTPNNALKYYREYKDKVNDITAFTEAYKKQYARLKNKTGE